MVVVLGYGEDDQGGFWVTQQEGGVAVYGPWAHCREDAFGILGGLVAGVFFFSLHVFSLFFLFFLFCC